MVCERISVLSIPNYSTANQTDAFAYYTNYTNNTAILFVNLEAAILCFNGRSLVPVCHLSTYEEDNFQQGRQFIQATDVGNDWRTFSSIPVETFGFGVSGCPTFDPRCVSGTEMLLVCLLPGNICGWVNLEPTENFETLLNHSLIGTSMEHIVLLYLVCNHVHNILSSTTLLIFHMQLLHCWSMTLCAWVISYYL